MTAGDSDMTTRPADPAGWRPLEVPGLMATVGPLLARRDGNGWRYALRTGPQHANAIGRIHGGTITTLADQAMAMSAWEAVERQPVVTLHMDARFVAAARPGDFLEVDTAIKHRTSAILFVEASIAAADTVVAEASSILRIVKSGTETPGNERGHP